MEEHTAVMSAPINNALADAMGVAHGTLARQVIRLALEGDGKVVAVHINESGDPDPIVVSAKDAVKTAMYAIHDMLTGVYARVTPNEHICAFDRSKAMVKGVRMTRVIDPSGEAVWKEWDWCAGAWEPGRYPVPEQKCSKHKWITIVASGAPIIIEIGAETRGLCEKVILSLWDATAEEARSSQKSAIANASLRANMIAEARVSARSSEPYTPGRYTARSDQGEFVVYMAASDFSERLLAVLHRHEFVLEPA